jgi:hypothetical protein
MGNNGLNLLIYVVFIAYINLVINQLVSLFNIKMGHIRWTIKFFVVSNVLHINY